MINEANRLALESIQSVRTVASFTLEDRIVETYSKTLDAPLRAGLRVFCDIICNQLVLAS
jgi:hypothetical protein